MVGALATGASQAGRQAAPGWRLTQHHDRFTGRTTCRIGASDHRLRYQPGAVGFRFRHHDTLDAWYRVDAGAPVRWQDRYPELIARGVAVDGPGLADPTGGIVWIPEHELLHADRVAIRLTPRQRPVTFVVRGLRDRLAEARQAMCGFDFARGR